jgi:transcriptional regulator with XRE-family HTH domain
MAKTSAPSLGSLLRALRARRGWTLKQMSDKTGIPVSTLSKVEHDRLTLTYDKLLQLSQRLNMRMSELFAETDAAQEPAAVTARRSIGSLDQAVEVSTPNYEYHYLCPELRRKRMIPVVAKIRARSIEEFGDLVRHPGEEFVFVLNGKIEVHTEFYDPVVLGEGQSIYLDSSMGHAYVAAEGCEEATVMAVNSAAEEGLMESLMSLHVEEDRRATASEPLRRKRA